MSKEELNISQEILNKGLEESYEKMLLLKMKLGQKVVISDAEGKPLTISAEQAWEEYQKNQTLDSRN